MTMLRLVAALAGFVAGAALQLRMEALAPRGAVLAAGGACAAAALGLLLAAAVRRRACSGRPVRPAHPVRHPALRSARAAWAHAMLVALLTGGLGFAATHERAAMRLAQSLDPALEGVDLIVTGVVTELPRETITGTRFVFEVEQARRDDAPVDAAVQAAVTLPPRLSLGWFRGPDDDALVLGAPEPVRAGQRWRLPVRLKRPHGSLNPRGFDLELYLFERDIGASGGVRARAGSPALKLGDAVCCAIERARQRLREAIARQVPDAAAAGVLAALAIGDQAAIERDDWERFRITGVAHLMSISGLHVTMFAWLAGAVIGALWRRSERLALAWPAPLAARWGGVVAAAAYALLAGWGVPAQRTVWMLAAVALARSRARRWPLHLVLAAAAAVVVAVDPWALLQPGFWLSFVAVALLAASEPPEGGAPGTGTWLQRVRALAASGLRTQAVATVGLAPLTLLFFQQVSLVGFAANLVAIPLVTLVITPLALAGAFVPPLWTAAALVLQGLNGVLEVLAASPMAVWHAGAAPPWAVAAGLLGGLLAVLPLPWRLRALALPLLVPIVLPPIERPPPGRFELVAADVGQGTALLVRTANRLLVYDTGPQYTPEADAGGRVLLPLLRARGERAIDLLVLSHRDSDHVGGAATLRAALPVRALATSLDDGHPLREGAVPHERCRAGARWRWDGVEFEWLHPTPADFEREARPNALSCVLKVSATGAPHAPGRSLLLTGDIEAAQEAALVARRADALAVDLLLVPHHGSRTSSTAAFLDATRPRLALVQAAYRSRFGHPAPEVLRRHAERGIEVVRSDRCGAFTLDASGGTRCERGAVRRYWHHPEGAAAPPLR